MRDRAEPRTSTGRRAAKGLAVLAALAASTVPFLATTSGAASAPLTFCQGDLGPEVVTGTLVVPDGVDCNLDRTTVTGNVLVGPGGALNALGVTVGGALVSQGARYVAVADCVEAEPSCHQPSRIAGSVVISGTNGQPPPEIGASVLCDATFIGGSLVLARNESMIGITRCTFESGVDVVGSVNVVGNTGGVELAHNRIGGSLTCFANQPPPFGSDNQVSGSKTGQCASL